MYWCSVPLLVVTVVVVLWALTVARARKALATVRSRVFMSLLGNTGK